MVSQALSTSFVRMNGSPDENPRTSSAAIFGWPKTFSGDRLSRVSTTPPHVQNVNYGETSRLIERDQSPEQRILYGRAFPVRRRAFSKRLILRTRGFRLRRRRQIDAEYTRTVRTQSEH